METLERPATYSRTDMFRILLDGSDVQWEIWEGGDRATFLVDGRWVQAYTDVMIKRLVRQDGAEITLDLHGLIGEACGVTRLALNGRREPVFGGATRWSCVALQYSLPRYDSNESKAAYETLRLSVESVELVDE